MQKVSVIIPCYNCEKTIENCLKSVLQQTQEEIEMIIINDGSSDKTQQIIEDFDYQNREKKIFSQENKGVSATRNFGIENCSGEYVMFVDSDDILEKNMIKNLFENLVDTNADLAVCGYNIYGGKLCLGHTLPNLEGSVVELYRYLYDNFCLNMIWNKLYKKKHIKSLFRENIHLGEDVIFNLTYLLNCNKMVLINNNLYNYYIYETGLHSKFYFDDYKTDRIIYELSLKIEQDMLEQNKISYVMYFDCIQRTFQRMIFSKKYSKHDCIAYLKEVLNQCVLNEVLEKAIFSDLQHNVFKRLFKFHAYKCIYYLYQLKYFLVIIRNRSKS